MKSFKYAGLFGSLIVLVALVLTILQKKINIKSSHIIETPSPTDSPTEPEELTTEPEENTTEPEENTTNADESTTATNTVNGLFILSIVIIGCMTLINIILFYMYISSQVRNDAQNKLIYILTFITCLISIPGFIGSIIVKNNPFIIVHSIVLGVNYTVGMLHNERQNFSLPT